MPGSGYSDNGFGSILFLIFQFGGWNLQIVFEKFGISNFFFTFALAITKHTMRK